MKSTPVRIRYASSELRAIVWRFKDVDDLPAGFSRDHGPVTGPEVLHRQYRFMFDGQVDEQFVVFLLNTQNKVQAVDLVSVGTINSSIVHPREVFRSAILGHCASIIVAHNHPSGNPEPSSEDIAITKQMVDAGKILGIPVHDHLIFAGDSYTSFAERGLI